jgi:hypothetical protein
LGGVGGCGRVGGCGGGVDGVFEGGCDNHAGRAEPVVDEVADVVDAHLPAGLPADLGGDGLEMARSVQRRGDQVEEV